MKTTLEHIAKLQSGAYLQPDINPDILYLQSNHFDKNGQFNQMVRPTIKLDNKSEKHLLKDGDVLFTAKGLNNPAFVYNLSAGPAIASTSFIVIRINEQYRSLLNPDYLVWFINHTKQVQLFHQQQLGTTIPSISIRQLAQLEIDIPDLLTQGRIVSIQRLRNREQELLKLIEEKKDLLIQYKLLKAIK